MLMLDARLTADSTSRSTYANEQYLPIQNQSKDTEIFQKQSNGSPCWQYYQLVYPSRMRYFQYQAHLGYILACLSSVLSKGV